MSNYSRFSRFALIAVAGVLMSMPLYGVNKTWTGLDITNNWSGTNNWSPTGAPVQFDSLFFAGSTRTNNFNDIFNTSFLGITFNAGASPFTLNGDTTFLGNGTAGTGNITNNSINLQTVHFTVPGVPNFQGLYLNNSQTFTAAAGDLLINGTNLGTNTFFAGPGGITLTIQGAHNTTISSTITNDPLTGLTPLSIVKEGTGTLVLGGFNNTYSGDVTINNGTVQVASTTALGLGNTNLNGLPIPQHGTLETFGPNALTFRVGNNYTQLGGTPFNILQMKIGGIVAGTTSDLMLVGNNAFLSGELFLHRINNYMPLPGDQVPIIFTGTTIAGGTRNGTFMFVASDFPGLIQPTVIYFAQEVDVRFVLAASFASQGRTFNQIAVGNALDLGFLNGCLSATQIATIGNLPVGLLPAAYDLIAPEEFGAMYEMSFSRAVVESSNLQHRMDQIRANADPNCGPIVEVAPAPAGKNVKEVMPAPAPAPEARFDTFAMGSGQYVAVHDQDANAQGYRITNGSFLAGADYSFMRMFAIGLYGGYVGSEATLVNHGQIISDGGTVGGYATFFTHGFYVQGSGGAGWNTYSNRRGGFGLGSNPMRFRETATSSTDGDEVHAMGAIGYDWNHTFVFANHPGTFTAGPIFSVQYTNLDLNGFTERGSLFPLNFPDQSQDSLRGTFGGKVALCVQTDHGIMWKPDVRVAYLREFNNDGFYEIDANFIGCPDLFTVRSPRIGEDAVAVNAGLTVQFNQMVSLFGHWDGIFGRDNYHSQAVSGGLSLSF
jgi:autotransporter-associated beta strand protein